MFRKGYTLGDYVLTGAFVLFVLFIIHLFANGVNYLYELF